MVRDCSQTFSKKIHVLQDRKTGSKASVKIDNKNEEEFTVIEFDGCLILNKTACDYVVTHKTKVIYVELKGSDIRKAHTQIVIAVDHYKKAHGGLSKTGIIAFTGNPKESTYIQIQKVKLRKSHQLKMICTRSPVTHQI
ncbi:hypothetical protein [Maridesulfovibrio sp.]|uniref:hypothetical protein n=1 Tax=Maridesulfovibrio sp. TaxID=2795000 RepID=UPI002A186F03|nr:hypothetical protein [Maridesulfovibrio sp.]